MFACWGTEALTKLKEVISQPAAFTADNVMATDNAVSALGKICEFQRDGIDSAQVKLLIDMMCMNATPPDTWFLVTLISA